MFGSTNTFGQSSSSPFGSQSVFGQTSNASNNPFTPKPFGSISSFGSQTSIFGGTSTGVFGAPQSSSPLASNPTFGASSTPAFGSSVPAFSTSSTPSFGSSLSSFGSSSVFYQKPAFGGFGSTPSQTSPFGSTFQQTQSAFGSNLFGSSTPFGASSQPAFGATSTSAFGATSTPAFGITSSPAFGSTSTLAFGSAITPAFGSASTSNGSINCNKDRDPAENDSDKEQTCLAKANQKANGLHEDHPSQKGDSYITLTGHRAGEAAIVYEHGADIEALMPKLRHADCYTDHELAAKEKAEPGFCQCVKDFVVGRHGYGSIKFIGETDVRRHDLESLVQFNNREVIVYMDDSKKPPVGQGLNKPAEVTLLNIKCFDKKTGQQYVEGSRVEKYKEMLIKKAQNQGAEFVSYDPLKGEWKFRVKHFSGYNLWDEEIDLDL